MRRLLAPLIALLLFPLQALAQPAPVPALPDTTRITTVSLASSTCACSVGFALYGDGTDVDNWLQVWNGSNRYLSTDPQYGWTLTSTSGSIGSIARPITNAILTFTNPQTGNFTLVGARRPRRLAEFSENRGVAARDLNQALTDVVAQNREQWDKFGRTLTGVPGEALTPLPPAASRYGQILSFDVNGNPIVIPPLATLGPPSGGMPVLNVIDYSAAGIDITNGTTDAGPAFQAAINACNHCIIVVPNTNTRTGAPAVCYNIVTPVTGHGHMTIQGTTNENAHLNGTDAGSSLCMGQSSAPMFTFPGETNLDGDVNVGWSFRRLRFDGKNVAQPIIYSPEANPGRGAWSAVIEENVFSKCNPCISAQNGWDWWVRNNSFNLTGNGSTTAAIELFNSAQNYGGAGSNSWHITNNAFDTSVGRAINFNSTGIGGADQFMVLTDNKFGPQGYESITGCLFLSIVANNEFEGTTTGLSTINLTGTNGGTTGCGRNRIVGNTLAGAGVYSINDGASLDLISSNIFYIQGSGSAHINLTAASAINTVSNNKSNDGSCCNTFPMVNDLGSSNSIFGNDGSDGVVTRQFVPEKLAGTQYYAPLFSSNTYQIDGAWTTYTPTLSCLSGALSTASAFGAYKRMGNTVFVTIAPTITAHGTCTNLQATLPFTAFYAGSISGTETGVTGKAVAGAFGGNSNVVLIRLYDGTTAALDGYVPTLNGVFPSQ